MIPLLCHPQSSSALSTHSLSVPPPLEHVHSNRTDVFDSCVSRCLSGKAREVAGVPQALRRFSFFSGPERRDGAGVPLTPLSKKKQVCCSKLDKECPQIPSVSHPWNSPYLSAAALFFIVCLEEALLFYFFVCGWVEFWQLQVWSSTLGETDWHWKGFWHDDGKSNGVISVIWRTELLHVCAWESSCNRPARLHNTLTETCQVNEVVSVITEIGSFYFQWYSIWVRCKDNKGSCYCCEWMAEICLLWPYLQLWVEVRFAVADKNSIWNPAQLISISQVTRFNLRHYTSIYISQKHTLTLKASKWVKIYVYM